MANIKMSVVVRRDLNLPPGLLAAQALHIGMEFIRQKHADPNPEVFSNHRMQFTPSELEWIWEPYVAILAVNTPEELREVIKMAKAEGLPVNEWTDVIPSEIFQGRVFKNLVGISIGPADSDALRKVTGTLPLY